MMKPSDPIHLLSALYDLPLVDKDGCYCGIVDDVRLDGAAGRDLAIGALLVGPGAYARRLPRWAQWLNRHLAGDRVTTVPWAEIDHITGAVYLKKPANELGLHVAENKARRLIPKGGAL
jgi:sporulation protein YlmC with PRC-barrel domain